MSPDTLNAGYIYSFPFSGCVLFIIYSRMLGSLYQLVCIKRSHQDSSNLIIRHLITVDLMSVWVLGFQGKLWAVNNWTYLYEYFWWLLLSTTMMISMRGRLNSSIHGSDRMPMAGQCPHSQSTNPLINNRSDGKQNYFKIKPTRQLIYLSWTFIPTHCSGTTVQ